MIDFEKNLSLSDCERWSRPEADCGGPRVGIRDGVIRCEQHWNAPCSTCHGHGTMHPDGTITPGCFDCEADR